MSEQLVLIRIEGRVGRLKVILEQKFSLRAEKAHFLPGGTEIL